MSTPDFFRSRLDQMIDLRHPLAVLSTRLPWALIEAAVAPKLAHQAKPAKRLVGEDLAGGFEGEFGGGVSPAEFAVECTRKIEAGQALGRLRLMGQLGRHRRLDQPPRQPRGQHGQRVPQIDHLIKARAKEVRRAYRQIAQKSGC